MRHRWNLNRILSDDGSGEKNRNDHRHHAVDAIVIALTSRGLFQRLSSLSTQSGIALSERGFRLDVPWQSFYEDVRNKIEAVIVSHASSRKISGALHEETAYGYSNHDKCFVRRKPLSSLTENEIGKIRDNKVRQLVQARITQFGGDIKKALGNSGNQLTHVDGKTPIKTIRIVENLNLNKVHGIKNRFGKAYKFFKYGNNHHVEIIENVENSRREGVFVTAIEAAKRARIDKTGIVQSDHGPEWRFVTSLCINDMIEITDNNGTKKYYRIQKMSDPSIVLRYHTSASTSDRDKPPEILRYTANTLKGVTVSIDCLGNVIDCHD